MPLIQFEKVSKRFQPANDGIIDISFVVDPGEFVLLTGPSGSGKTTLLKLLTREYQLTSGTILFHDQDIGKLKNRQLPEHRRKIGVVYQDYRLISELSVEENVALPLLIAGSKASVVQQRVQDLLTLVKMNVKAKLFPSQLSGGEAQRVSIARALALGPDLIFADEPTGNLDSATSTLIAQLLQKINQLGTTILFATHDATVLNLFAKQRKLVLREGTLTEDSRTKATTPSSAPTKTESTANSNSKPNAKAGTKSSKKS